MTGASHEKLARQQQPTAGQSRVGPQVEAGRRRTGARPDNAWYKLLWIPVLAALAVGIGLYATGAPPSRAIGIALVVAVVAWLVIKSFTLPTPIWPSPADDLADWGRVRKLWDVPGLEAALERPQYMSRRILVQLAATTEALLQRRQLTLAHPRAAELLSPRGIDLLTDPEATPPTRKELQQLIDTIVLLATDGGDGSRPLPVPPALVVRPPVRRGIRHRPATGPGPDNSNSDNGNSNIGNGSSDRDSDSGSGSSDNGSSVNGSSENSSTGRGIR